MVAKFRAVVASASLMLSCYFATLKPKGLLEIIFSHPITQFYKDSVVNVTFLLVMYK